MNYVLGSYESTFQLVLGKNRHWVYCAKKERKKETSRLLSATGPKTNICHRMGYITAHRMGDLHMCDSTTHVGTDVDIRIESWLNPWLFRLRKCQASMCMCNNSIFVDRVSLLDFPACFPDLAIANHEEDNKTMMTMDCCKHASVPTFLECVRAIKIKIHLNWSVKTLDIFFELLSKVEEHKCKNIF